MSDVFFTQIQEAEQKAKDLFAEASKKVQEELLRFEKKLEVSRKLELDKKRKKYQELLAQKNVEGREVFEQRQGEGKKNVQGLRKDAEERQSKIVPVLEAYFLNELLIK